MSRDDGQAMLDAGARLLQVYTGFVYGGPALVAALNRLAPASRSREWTDDGTVRTPAGRRGR